MERSREILKAIVQDYIRTAEPVSSKAVTVNYGFGLSSATIRNIMAELESEGFLVQPHTSAGRVPTDKGFRFYVDTLLDLDLEEPRTVDKALIKKNFERALTIESVLTETAKALSSLTSCAGVMFTPRKDSFVIKHINLLPMDRTGIMVLIVSTLGLVQTRLIRMEADSARLDIERITNYLNSIAKGLTIRELRARVVEEMRSDKNLYDELLNKALSLGAMVLQEDDGAEESGIHVEGGANMLSQPEFRDDFERMKKLFTAFEEKSLLVKLLDKHMDETGIHIYLGSESAVEEFNGLSFVTAPYGRGGSVLGTVGVIGPVRMNYSKIIPLVDYSAGLLSKVL